VGYSLGQGYDGDGLRVYKNDSGVETYYLRSTVLGGQVIADIDSSGTLTREYVYLGGQVLAFRGAKGKTYWVHQDPITKSKRVTSPTGNTVSTIELDPWGGDTTRSNNAAFQPRKFTSYERDANGSDEAMFRRYNRWQSRFDQPDPYEGSYDYSNPQSFNRYAYVQGDPVNFVDPTGLTDSWNGYCSAIFGSCAGTGGGGYSRHPFDSGLYSMGGYNDLPGRTRNGLRDYDERVGNAWAGYGFLTNAQVFGATFGRAEICLEGFGCWDGGTFTYTTDPTYDHFFGAGTLDQWPPQWPREIDGYSSRYGWRTQPPPKMDQFPEKTRLGPKGVERVPDFDPNAPPGSPSRGTKFARVGIAILKGLATGGITDFIGPVVLPYPQVKRSFCRQNPNHPECGGGMQ